MSNFSIRPYGVGELAALYFPHIQQSSAVNQLRRWIVESPVLLEELQSAGWKRYRKVFSPKQVAIILDHLGEPESASAISQGRIQFN
jgi:predicted Zn-dependent protease